MRQAKRRGVLTIPLRRGFPKFHAKRGYQTTNGKGHKLERVGGSGAWLYLCVAVMVASIGVVMVGIIYAIEPKITPVGLENTHSLFFETFSLF